MQDGSDSPGARSRLRFVIVTVSTSKYRKKSNNEEVNDQSGDSAEAIVRRSHVVSDRFLISDDRSMLKARVEEFLSGTNDVIIFVGGTGVSPDDVTIESIRPYVEKELDGFGEIFRRESYGKIGSPAFLSRATAGVSGGKLVVCLPGSPDAVDTALGMFIGQFPSVILSARS